MTSDITLKQSCLFSTGPHGNPLSLSRDWMPHTKSQYGHKLTPCHSYRAVRDRMPQSQYGHKLTPCHSHRAVEIGCLVHSHSHNEHNTDNSKERELLKRLRLTIFHSIEAGALHTFSSREIFLSMEIGSITSITATIFMMMLRGSTRTDGGSWCTRKTTSRNANLT